MQNNSGIWFKALIEIEVNDSVHRDPVELLQYRKVWTDKPSEEELVAWFREVVGKVSGLG